MATRRKPQPSGPQTELFPARNADAPPAKAQGGDRAPGPNPPAAKTAAALPPDAPARTRAIEALLGLSVPVRAGSRAAAWLKARRVFRKTWDAQGLRVVDNYHRASEGLVERFSAAQLAAWGLFNKDGHLRFYRHTLLIPWFDGEEPAHLQARAPDPDVVPPELSLAGPVPCPYNARLLDGAPGRLYLCGGVLDTLELLEAGFPAVGLPEGHGIKIAWLPRFRNKSVYIAFDADANGEAAAAKAIALLTGQGVEAHRLRVPAGKDVGEWLAGK